MSFFEKWNIFAKNRDTEQESKTKKRAKKGLKPEMTGSSEELEMRIHTTSFEPHSVSFL